MNPSIPKLFVWLTAASIVFITYTFGIGLYPKNFHIEWDEEVQLHDGRVIVIHIKNTYERLHREFGRYTSAIPRDTEISFNTGTTRVTQLFKGYHPLLIDQHQGTWYAVIYGSDYYKSNEIPDQNWGEHWYDCSPAAVLQGNQFKPFLIYDLPTLFDKPNMLLLYGDASEHSRFEGKKITLKDKSAWLLTHPPGYGHASICRPPKNAPKPLSRQS